MENENTAKINFFKKIWYSFAKPSKYEDMRNEGVWIAIKYFMSLIAIFAIILSIIATNIQTSDVNKAISYLEENLPEITFKENKLATKENKETVLDDKEFIEKFANVVVINTNIDKEKAVEKYSKLATDKHNVITFLNEEYIVLTNKNNKEEIPTYKYTDIASKYIKDNSVEYKKENIISYVKQRTSYTYFLAQFFVFYLGMYTILYLLYILLISGSLWVVTKISKHKWKFKEAVMNTTYASTLSLITYIIYTTINFFVKFTIPFMDIISIMLVYIYIFLILRREKLEEGDAKVEKG